MSIAIEWCDAYSIDGGIIDAQHKQLLNLAGRLMEFDEAVRPQGELKEIVMQLYKYMEDHFHREEHLAESSGYPKLDVLVKAHREIIEEMNGMMKTCTDYRKLCVQLRKILFAWVTNHILNVDKDLGRHLEATKAAAPKEEAKQS